jgi:hypothetical protein
VAASLQDTIGVRDDHGCQPSPTATWWDPMTSATSE